MGDIERWTDESGAEGVVIDSHLSVYAKPSMEASDGTVAVGIDLPWLDQLQGAVDALVIAREALEHYAHGPYVDTDTGHEARDALARIDAGGR